MPRSNHCGNPGPKVFSTRPQGPVLVSDCFLIYPFQLERNRREYVPLSNPVGAPVPVSLQLPYITSSQQDMPSCFATTQACCCCSAKSLQSCPTLCDLIDSSPPGSPLPGILQARTLERVAISFSSAWKWRVKVKSLSCVRPLATPWTAAHQAPPSIGFSRQEYWSGSPLPSPLKCPSLSLMQVVLADPLQCK